MDNMHQSAGDDPHDFSQTQHLWPAAGTGEPAGPAVPGGPGGPGRPGNGGSQPPGRRGRALRWGAGIAIVALLAGGGAFAASSLTGNSARAALAGDTTSTAAGPTGQAAQLNAIISSAASPGAASAAAAFDSATAAGRATAAGPLARCRRLVVRLWTTGHRRAARRVARACRRLRRVRLLGGMYGQFTFRTKSGVRTIAYERGAVQSISGGAVVVRAADGTTETWTETSKTVVRQDGRKATASALSDGQQVFVAGPVLSGAHDIRLAVIRPARPAPASGSPASGSSAVG